jgi:hypothetical protein
MDKSILRMKMVIVLLFGVHNESREVIIQATNELWLPLHVKCDEGQILKKQKRWSSAHDSKTCDA